MDYGASQEKGRVMDQVRSQIAVANLQEMIIVSPLPHRTHALHLSVAACGTCMPVPLLPSQKMSDKCFRKCVSSPSSALDGREQVSLPRPLLWLVSVSQLDVFSSSPTQKCLGNCMDRYMESWNIVSRAYTDKLRKDSGQH